MRVSTGCGDGVLVVGPTGQLGTAILRALPEANGLGRDALDLETATSTRTYDELAARNPLLVINCAAYTAVDRAETDRSAAMRINTTAPELLARACTALGARFVTFSTDYVFDGEQGHPYVESDETSPINVYGESKRLGELAVMEADASALVIRTSWLVSVTHVNFITKILTRTSGGEPCRVVDDQRGCPTSAHDLALATLTAISQERSGILHLVNSDTATWFELAETAMQVAGIDPSLLERCTSDDYITTARRPRYSVLGSERMTPADSIVLPPWRRAVEAIVEQLYPNR